MKRVASLLCLCLLLSRAAVAATVIGPVLDGILPLTDGTTIAVDATKAYVFSLTITGSGHTISNPTGQAAGHPLNFIITQNGTGGFTPAWGTHFNFPGGTPALNTAANQVSLISCVVQTPNTASGIQCLAGPQGQGIWASFQGAPTNPTGTSSTTGVMMGMGTTCTVTPTSTGRIRFTFDGAVGDATIGNGATMALRYGTGTAPANAAALTGTVLGASPQWLVSTTAARYPYALIRLATGLTVGTAYWFDLSLTANAATLASVLGNTCTAEEY